MELHKIGSDVKFVVDSNTHLGTVRGYTVIDGEFKYIVALPDARWLGARELLVRMVVVDQEHVRHAEWWPAETAGLHDGPPYLQELSS